MDLLCKAGKAPRYNHGVKRGAVILAGLFLLGFAAMAACANPSISWDDAGEFTSVAHSLSVLHPPGYPLTILGIKAVESLLPVPLAFAANLWSVLMANVAVVLCAAWGGLLARRAGAPPQAGLWLSALAGLALLSHRHFFYLAMTVETYHLNVALVLLGLMVWTRWVHAPTLGQGLLIGFLMAQASLVHYTGLVFGLLWTVWMLRQPWRWWAITGMLWLGLLTLSLAMITPLRSAANVPFKWFGGVNGPRELLAYLAGSDLGKTFTLKEQFQFLVNYSQNLVHQSAPLAHLVPWVLLPALWWAWRRNAAQSSSVKSALALGLMVMALMSGLVLQLLLMFEFRPIKIMSINLFYLPHAAVLSGALAFGLGATPGLARRLKGPLAWGLLGVMAAGAVWWGVWPNRNQRDRMAQLMALDIMRSADYDSRVFMDWSLIGFPMVHAILSLHYRGDVAFYDRRDNLGPFEYRMKNKPEQSQLAVMYQTEKRLIASRPAKTSYFMSEEAFRFGAEKWGIVPRGLLLEVATQATRPQWESLFPYFRFPGDPLPRPPVYVERSALGHFNLLRALEARGRGKKEEAIGWWRNAIRVAPDDQRVLMVAGRFLSELGEKQAARRALEKSLEVNPRLAPGGSALVKLLVDQGRLGDAEKVLAKQENGKAALTLAVAFEKKQNLEKALLYYNMAIRHRVGTWRAMERAGALAYSLGDFREAMTLFDQASKAGHPKPDDMRLNTALAAYRAREFATAEKALLELKKKHPQDVDIWWNLASLYSEKIPRPKEAVKGWESVLQLAPNHPRRAYAEQQLLRQKALAGGK